MEDREERAQDSEYGWIFDKPQEKAGMQDGMEAETQSVPEKKKTAARKRTRKTGSDGQENSRGQEKEAGAGGSSEDPRSIEELFEELDLMIRKLEDGSSSLEDSFRYYEEGMKLVKACSGKIDRVEKQIVAVNDTGGEYGA